MALLAVFLSCLYIKFRRSIFLLNKVQFLSALQVTYKRLAPSRYNSWLERTWSEMDSTFFTKRPSRASLPSEIPLCAQFHLTSSSISAVCFLSLIAMLFVSRLNCFYWSGTVLSNDFSCKPHLIWFMTFTFLPQIQLQDAYSTSKSIILNITSKVPQQISPLHLRDVLCLFFLLSLPI